MGQVEGAFSQPNAGVCERMIEWAHAATAGSHDGDLLELYCGAGQAATGFCQCHHRRPAALGGCGCDVRWLLFAAH